MNDKRFVIAVTVGVIVYAVTAIMHEKLEAARAFQRRLVFMRGERDKLIAEEMRDA